MSKTLFITGGTSGTGAATAQPAVVESHQVYVTGRSGARLRELLDSFDATSRARITGNVADASSWEETSVPLKPVSLVSASRRGFCQCRIFLARGDLVTGDPESWRDMVMTNVL